MTMLEADTGWQNAFNLVNPKGLRVAQLIMILEQDDRKGFGAVMIDKPFMGEATQTECVDDILERVTEVAMKGLYQELRDIGNDLGTESGPADYADNGRRYAYGKKTKSKHHRTPDSLANSKQRTIRFTDDDRKTAEHEADGKDLADDLEETQGFRPHGIEW